LREAQISDGPGSALAFAGGALLPIVGLSLAANYQARLIVTLLIGGASGGLLLAQAYCHADPSATLLLVDAALVALAWAVGTSIGARVQDPSHLLPACVVAGSADLVSVLSPEGPSHAIAKSDQALSVLATWFPVPGSHAVAPARGFLHRAFVGVAVGLGLSLLEIYVGAERSA